MLILEDILSQEIIQKLGWTLLHFIWQAAVAALLVAILLRVLRKSTANLRYIIACLALTLIVLLPVITIKLVPVSVPQSVGHIEPAPAPAVLSIEEMPPAETIIVEEPEQLESVAPISADSWKQRAVDTLEPALPYIVSGWLFGVFGLSIWHLGGWSQLQRLKRRMVKQVDDALSSKLKVLAQRLRVKQTVQLMESALVQIPTVVGWLRPVILLPASALTGLTSEQLEAILAHELAHIKRFDYLLNMLQTFVEILGFYHPAVWWISHKIRAERENCCDDLAVRISGDRVCYARALASMEEIRAGRGQLAVAATGGNLLGRIRRLVGKDVAEKNSFSWIPAATVILLIIALTIPATITLTARAQEKPEGLANAVIKGIRLNRDKFECGYLAWSSKRIDTRYEGSRGNLSGQYELWWDGKKITTKYVRDQVYKDPEGRYRVEEQQGGTSYDGGILSRKPNFREDNWLGPNITRWRGKGSQDWLMIRQDSKQEGISKDWSVVENNGVKLIRVITRNMNETARDFGAYSIRDYDSSKGYGLVNEEWYNPDGSPRLKHTVKMLEVISGGWFPVEVDLKSFTITDGRVYNHSHYALDIERCSFNDKSALPDRVFKGAVDKQLKYHQKLQKYLAMELEGISDVKEAAKADRVKRGAREAIEKFVAAALAGDLEKAGEYAHPDRLPANQIADITEIAKGQNLWIMAVIADDFSAIAVSSVIQGDHDRTGPLVFSLDRVALDGRDNWWVHDIDMETPDGAEVELKQFLEKHPEAEKIPSEKKPDVQVEAKSNVPIEYKKTESAVMLKKLGLAVAMYADDHDDNLPDSLKELKPYIRDEQDFNWLLYNIKYLGSGKSAQRNTALIPIAYDRELLEEADGTNVLSLDFSVRFLETKEFEKLDIKRAEFLIEARFLSVSENFLQSISLDADSPDEAKALVKIKSEMLAASDGSKTQSLILDERNVSLLLKAVHANKDSKVLAVPQVICWEDKTAKISVVTVIPFITGYTEPNRPSEKPQPKFDNVEEGITMSLRPKLTPKKYIDMEFELEITNVPGFEERKYKGKYPYKLPSMQSITQSTRYIAHNGQTLLSWGHKISKQQDGRTKQKDLLVLIKAQTAGSSEQDKSAQVENVTVSESARTTSDMIVPPAIAKSRIERRSADEQEKTKSETKLPQTTQIFHLKHNDTPKMVQIVKPLLTNTGHLSTDERTNSLIVSDTAENMKRIELIIKEYDVSKPDETITEIFEIRNGDPVEIVELLKKLINGRPDNGSIIEQGKQPIVFVPEPRRKWIIAKASAEDMKQIGEWIEKLDREEPAPTSLEQIDQHTIKPHEMQKIRQEYINNDPRVKSLSEKIAKDETELIAARQKFIRSHPEVRKKDLMLQVSKKNLDERIKAAGKSFDDTMTKETYKTYKANQEKIAKLLDELREPNLPLAPEVPLITSTFIDADLIEVLQDIASMAGIPIIPDETVVGLVTAELQNVPLDTALDIVLAGTPYVVKKTPYYYLVASAVEPLEIQKRVDSAKKLSNLGKALLIYANDHEDKYPDSLHTFIEYLKLEDFNWAMMNIEYLARGKTSADRPDTVMAYDKTLLAKGKGTNVLYNDCHVGFEKAEELKKLNIGRRILINTKLLSVSKDFLKDVGLDADSIHTSVPWSQHLAAKYPAEPNSETFGLIIDDLHVSFLLRALGVHKDAHVLSSPQVLCLEGKKAEIIIMTEEYHYVSGYNKPNSPSDKPQQKLDKVEIGTHLWLKPILSPDNKNVDLGLKLEISQLKGIIEGKYKGKYPYHKPIVDVISTETRTVVPNGKTLLIGGLKINEKEKEPRAPRLKDLPLIGGIFSSKDKAKDQKMLLILVKPITNPQQKASKIFRGEADSEEHIKSLARLLEKKLNRPAD